MREYIDDKIAAMKCQIDAHFKALDKAQDLSTRILETRLEGMNKFREENRELTNTFVRRREHEMLDDRIDKVEAKLDRQEGKASQSSVIWAYGLSLVSILIGIIAIIEKVFIK